MKWGSFMQEKIKKFLNYKVYDLFKIKSFLMAIITMISIIIIALGAPIIFVIIISILLLLAFTIIIEKIFEED